jgi:isopenicillin-N N-acyltransferase like protein
MIPLIRATGTHAQTGARIGEETRDAIRRGTETLEFDIDLVLRYRAPAVKYLPWVVEEIDACAAAAEVDPLRLFAACVDELSFATRREAMPARCTDLAATPAITADNHLLVAHNNDLVAGDEHDVVAIEWKVEDEPTIFTLGIGPWISVGWNEAGLSVTGNEVAPKDEGVGVPRLLQVRDVLTRTTLPEAVKAILHPARASSYNWVVAQGDYAVSIEGSATVGEGIAPAPDGTLVHTNHYVHPEMLDYEGSEKIEGSATRLHRARELLSESLGEPVTRTRLRTILSDHENAPDSLCRHGHRPDDPQTAFWCIADVTTRTVMYGRGNPCDSEAELYAFT